MVALVLLPWALWATMETSTVPATRPPMVRQEILHRFETYQQCDQAAQWAESQPDLREDYQVVGGQKWRSVMRFDCRKG